MKVRYKKKIYYVQWPKRFDIIIEWAAKRYKKSCGTINWKDAEYDGALKGLPVYLNLKDISRRNSYFKFSKDPEWKNKKLKHNREYMKTHPSSGEITYREKLYSRNIPEDLKRKHGWKPRGFWKEKQKQFLLILVEKYRKSKVTIDWIKLAKDKRVKKFPVQDSFKLCKYYNSLKRKGGKEYISKHREGALKYKYEHYKAYLEGQKRRRIARQNAVNEFLLSKLELR